MAIIFATKLAIVFGAVYVTRQIGIWDSSDRAAEIYYDIKSDLLPCVENLKKQFCSRYCVIGTNEMKPFRETWIDAWNESLKIIFLRLSLLPEYWEKFTNDVQMCCRGITKGDSDTTKVGQEETNPKSE